MSTTHYTQIDLVNEQIFDNTLVNATNIGGPDPNVNISGSFIDNAFSLLGTDVNKTESSSVSWLLLYDINHGTPPNPIPSNARITKVTIVMQTATPAAAASISVTMPNQGPPGFHGGHVVASAVVAIDATPSAMDTSLGTLTNISANQTLTSPDQTGVTAESASVNPTAINIGYEVDFTTNPGGMFPLGYMIYADFLTNFANMVFSYSVQGIVTAQWLSFSPVNHPNPASGSASGSVSIQVDNFSMDVEWDVPLAWTISPSSLTLPANTVTISRPDPGVPPDQDTEMLQSLVINGVTLTPNSPAIIIWTRFLIIIHLTPDLIASGSLGISGTIIGTEFSGTVSLGAVTITLADLSGIYTFDTTLHHDVLYARTTTSTTVTTQTVAIPAPFFVTAYFNDSEEEIMHYTGVRMRVTGAGTLKRVFQSYDVINTEQLADLAMLTAINTLPFALANFIDQNASLRVYTSSTDDYMVVSSLVVYINPIYTGYPQ